MTPTSPAAAALLVATFAVVTNPTGRFEPVAQPAAEARSDAAAPAPRTEPGPKAEAAETRPAPRVILPSPYADHR